MSNYFGQLPPQFNNKYNNNGLVSGYRQYTNTNVPFRDNPMLANNPLFYGSIRDNDFYKRVNMAKMEQLKRIKSVNELGMDQQQLTKFIICPIKVEKMDESQFINLFNTRTQGYIMAKGRGNLNWEDAPDIIQQMWRDRTNNPYKSILKNAFKKEDYDTDYNKYYNREFKKSDDLIVHKITQLDKDTARLESEYKDMMNIRKLYGEELGVTYSASEKLKHKKEFDTVHKFKNKIRYDPKNYDELKQFYKREQKKIRRKEKRVDEMIDMLLSSDQLTPDEITQLQKVAQGDNTIETVTKMEKVFERGEKYLEKRLKKKLKKQIGSEQYSEVMDALEQLYSDNNDNDNDVETKSEQVTINKSRIKLKKKHVITDDTVENNSIESDASEFPEVMVATNTEKRAKIRITRIKQNTTDLETQSESEPRNTEDNTEDNASVSVEKKKIKITRKKVTDDIDSNEKIQSVGQVKSVDIDKYKSRKNKTNQTSSQ